MILCFGGDLGNEGYVVHAGPQHAVGVEEGVCGPDPRLCFFQIDEGIGLEAYQEDIARQHLNIGGIGLAALIHGFLKYQDGLFRGALNTDFSFWDRL